MLRAYLALVPILLLLAGCAAPAQADISAPAPIPAPKSDIITTAPSSFTGPVAQQNYTEQSKFQPIHHFALSLPPTFALGLASTIARVGSVQPGTPLNIDGSSVASDGTWFHIASGEWIRGDLVGECGGQHRRRRRRMP